MTLTITTLTDELAIYLPTRGNCGRHVDSDTFTILYSNLWVEDYCIISMTYINRTDSHVYLKWGGHDTIVGPRCRMAVICEVGEQARAQ